MKQTEWRPGDDERPVKLFDRMPTRDDLDQSNPHLFACSLRLIEHGINPWNIPEPFGAPDALTPDGYLQPTGRIIGNEIETERIPWTIPADAVAEILEHYWNGLAEQRGLEAARLEQAEQKPPAEPGVDALRRAADAMLAASRATAERRKADGAATRARKAADRAFAGAIVAVTICGFGVGWFAREIFAAIGL
jgi:hypothetical protein